MGDSVPKAKASGPLWAWADSSGDVQVGSLSSIEGNVTRFPVRVIPGHGKVVPVELVEAVRKAYDNVCDAEDEDECIDAHDALARAFDEAIRGAV